MTASCCHAGAVVPMMALATRAGAGHTSLTVPAVGQEFARRGRGADDPKGHIRGGKGKDDPVGHG